MTPYFPATSALFVKASKIVTKVKHGNRRVGWRSKWFYVYRADCTAVLSCGWGYGYDPTIIDFSKSSIFFCLGCINCQKNSCRQLYWLRQKLTGLSDIRWTDASLYASCQCWLAFHTEGVQLSSNYPRDSFQHTFTSCYWFLAVTVFNNCHYEPQGVWH